MGKPALDAVIATALDVVGLLAVAAGAGLAAAALIGAGGGLVVAGGIVLGGVRLAEYLDRPGGDQ